MHDVYRGYICYKVRGAVELNLSREFFKFVFESSKRLYRYRATAACRRLSRDSALGARRASRDSTGREREETRDRHPFVSFEFERGITLFSTFSFTRRLH